MSYSTLRRAGLALCAICSAVVLSACVAGPVGFGATVYAPTAYVAPAYPVPGPGYEWAFHANYGWGWRHPVYGWSAGWR